MKPDTIVINSERTHASLYYEIPITAKLKLEGHPKKLEEIELETILTDAQERGNITGWSTNYSEGLNAYIVRAVVELRTD